MPLSEKQHINSPTVIGFWSAGMSMVMMLVGSAIMGMSLYRDIEFGTKDYYLTYPITRRSYFWGRFFGSFLFILLIGCCIPLGAYLGTKIGPYVHTSDRFQYGPNIAWYYIQPFLTIVLPNLIFTSCLFFGLVAITRNVKVVYTGGIILLLGYFVSLFFLGHSNDLRSMILSDPFLLTGSRIQMSNSNTLQQNTDTIHIQGDYLTNRLIWTSLGVVILLITYWRFSFARFFSGRRDKARIDEGESRIKSGYSPASTVSFKNGYNRRIFASLTRLELTNIVRDAYFWIIVGMGVFFLSFAFSKGDDDYYVPYFPQTWRLLAVYYDVFLFFTFFILLFYTGETLHRDRATRYALIQDSLPPPNWVINGSRLTVLLTLALGFAFLPLIIGVTVQLCHGYHDFDWPLYFSVIGEIVLPLLIEMVLFCYVVHVVINNKFAAHGVAAVLWLIAFFLTDTHVFDYHLLVYATTPLPRFGELDGLGNLAGPIRWFQVYWLLFGSLLIIIAALFFHRGVITAWKERLQLLRERFDRPTKAITVILLTAFLAVGGWLYYNVSYLNDYTTHGEQIDRGIEYERALKHYDSLPVPVLTRAKLAVDLYPDEKKEEMHGTITILNTTDKLMGELLIDGDALSDYSLAIDGTALPYTTPLIYHRAKLNLLRPANDTAPYRLYKLPRTLAPGDSAVVTIHSVLAYQGIANSEPSGKALRNGWVSTAGLPEAGYDADDEITSPYERRTHHLPQRLDDDDAIPQNDPIGIRTLKAGKSGHLYQLELTVSTSEGQTAVAPGDLTNDWSEDNRHYFHYTLSDRGSYPPLSIFSAHYACTTDSVLLDHKIDIRVFYTPEHGANVQRFIAGYKAALAYYSKAYGPYPYKSISLVEGSIYTPQHGSLPALDMLNENFAWGADFRNPNAFDYCYYTVAGLTAQQWWRFQTAPNETIGALDIPEGLAWYGALVLTEHNIGAENMRWILLQQLWPYLFRRGREDNPDNPLIKANFAFVWGHKAALELYALRDLIGEENMNAALRSFKDSFAYKARGPYAGAPDLYSALKTHTPDSVQYFLTDSWLKRRFYDSKLDSVTVKRTGNADEYKVTMYLTVAKTYLEPDGRETQAAAMDDYIDIGIFGNTPKDSTAAGPRLPFLRKFKLTAGPHVITTTVHGEPHSAGIDPRAKLVDRSPGDNIKYF